MATSSKDIDDALRNFSTANSRRARMIQRVPLGGTPSDSRSSGGTSMVGSDGVPKSVKELEADRTKAANESKNIKPKTSDIIDMLYSAGAKGQVIDEVKKFATSGSDTSKMTDDVIGALLEYDPDSENDSPQNFAQWAINLLGVGGYASAELANSITDDVNATSKGRDLWTGEKHEDYNPLRDSGASRFVQSVGKGAVAVGKGVAEGFGARFDNNEDGDTKDLEDRAVTYQKVFEKWGVNDVVRQASEDAGATEKGAGFWDNTGTWVALTGIAGDIAGDPLTYASGLGLTKMVRGALRSATQSAKEGATVREAVSQAAKEGVRAQKAAYAAGRDAKADRRAAADTRKQTETTPLTEVLGREADTIVDDVADMVDEPTSAHPSEYETDTDSLLSAVYEQNVIDITSSALVHVPRAVDSNMIADDLLGEMAAKYGPAGVPAEAPTPAAAAGIPSPIKTSAEDPRIAAVNEVLGGLGNSKRSKINSATLVEKLGRPMDETIAGTGDVTNLHGLILGARELLSGADEPFEEGAGFNQARSVDDIVAQLDIVGQTAQGQKFLNEVVNVGDSEMSMRNLAETVSRMTNAADQLTPETQAMYDDLIDAFDGAVARFTQKTNKAYSTGRLKQIFDENGVDMPESFSASSIIKALKQVPLEDRADALTGILSQGQGRVYTTLDEAIDGSVKGELDREDMTKLLDALGIKYHGNTGTVKLRKMLSEKAPAQWDAIWNSQKTNDQVLISEGISETAAEIAPIIDVEAAAVQAVDDFTRAADDIGVDPTSFEPIPEIPLEPVTPGQGSFLNTEKPSRGPVPKADPNRRPAEPREGLPDLVPNDTPIGVESAVLKSAAAESLKVADEIIEANKGVSGRNWYAVHQVIARQIGRAANNVKNAAGRQGLEGVERAAFADKYYLPTLRLMEKYMLSKGQVPKMNTGNVDVKVEPLYVSPSQLFDTIDVVEPGLTARLLFTPAHEAVKKGKAYKDGKLSKEAAAALEKGFTIYPNDLAAGAIATVLHGVRDPQMVVDYIKVISSSRNKTMASGAFDDLLMDYAKVVTRPEVVRSLNRFHEANQVLHAARSLKKSDELVNLFVEKFTYAMSKGGSHGEILDLLDEAEDVVLELAADVDSKLIRQLYASRINNGLLNTLREGALSDLRAGQRVADRAARRDAAHFKAPEGAGKAEDKIAAQRAEKAAEEVATSPKEKNGKRKATVGAVSAEQHVRNLTGDETYSIDQGIFLDDIESVITADVAADVANGLIEPTAFSAFEETIGRSFKSLFMRGSHYLNQTLNGSAGHADLAGGRVAATGSLYGIDNAFKEGLSQFVHGGPKVRPLAKRLQEIHGQKFTTEEALARVNEWYSTLAAAARFAMKSSKEDLPSSEDILAIAAKGINRDPLAGVAGSVPAVDPADLDLVGEVLNFINTPFGRRGRMVSQGLSMPDILKELQYRGFKDKGKYSAYAPKLDDDASANSMIWTQFAVDGDVNALDMLSNWMGAMTAAAVKPTAGAFARAQHGRVATGAAARELAEKGWKRFDPKAADADLARFLGEDVWFPPEIAAELPYLQKGLNYATAMSTRAVNAPVMQNVLKVTDFVTRVLKSLNTVYNPAHHATSIMGENMMMMISGVNPNQQVRSARIMAATRNFGKVTEDDLLASFDSSFPEAAADLAVRGGAGKNRWASNDVRIVLKDGTVVGLSPEQAIAMAKRANVFISPHNSVDIVGEGEGLIGRTTEKVSRSRKNLLARLDKRVGIVSASRDNVSRLAHFFHSLEDGAYNSVDDAMTTAAGRVHLYHPTVLTMSPFERNVNRRVVYFYTWVRQAFGAVLEVAGNNPAILSVPAKIQYNFAEAQGMEPDSFGHPNGRDPRIPTYFADDVVGATRLGGYGPLDSVDDIPTDPETGEPIAEPQQWAYNLSLPQFDTFNQFFSGWKTGDPRGSAEAIGGQVISQLNPIIGTPLEVAFDTRAGGFGKPPSEDENYWINKLGVFGRLDKIAGGQPNENWSPAQNQGEIDRASFNWWSGLKTTNITSESAASSAKYDVADAELSKLRDLGLNETQIKTVRAWWKARREAK